VDNLPLVACELPCNTSVCYDAGDSGVLMPSVLSQVNGDFAIVAPEGVLDTTSPYAEDFWRAIATNQVLDDAIAATSGVGVFLCNNRTTLCKDDQGTLFRDPDGDNNDPEGNNRRRRRNTGIDLEACDCEYCWTMATMVNGVNISESTVCVYEYVNGDEPILRYDTPAAECLVLDPYEGVVDLVVQPPSVGCNTVPNATSVLITRLDFGTSHFDFLASLQGDEDKRLSTTGFIVAGLVLAMMALFFYVMRQRKSSGVASISG